MKTAQDYAIEACGVLKQCEFGASFAITTIRDVIVRAILDERKGCAEIARDGGMHHTQEQEIRDAVVDSILARPHPMPPVIRHRTIEVSVLGHDIPVEIEYEIPKTDEQLYEMAKEKIRKLL
jgi:hypothetical protein